MNQQLEPESVYEDDEQPDHQEQREVAPVRPDLKLRPWEVVVALVCVVAAVGVAVIGLVSSYTAVAHKAGATAAQGGWGWEHPWMLPIAVDLSIIAFGMVNLLLIRFEREAAWVKWVPRGLTALTIWLNWQAGVGGVGAASHAGVAAVWVVFSEIAAHLYAAYIGRLKGRTPMEGVRFSRWVLSPVSTAKIARQMKLWEIRSYDTALKLHQDRIVYRELLTQRHGKKWRKAASREELMPLTLAPYGVSVEKALNAPALRAEADALRLHEADLRARALRLRVQEEEATEALRTVERRADIDAAQAKAEARRLLAEAEKIKAEEEARTAADAVLRAHEAQLRIKEAEAQAEADRLLAEAEAQATKAAAQARAEAEEIRRRSEDAQLKAQIEQERLKAQAAEQARLAKLEADRKALQAEAELERQRAQSQAEQARLAQQQAEAERQRAQAARKAAEEREAAAVAARNASVAQSQKAVAEAEAERLTAEEKRRAAEEAAAAAALEKDMAEALEAASVAAARARRSPAEREALIVADMIERFGEKTVTLRYIEENLGLKGGTAQDRRDRARLILAARTAGTEDAAAA